MRVAQRMISRNYKRQVNSAMKKQADALERSESGLSFKYLSENVAAGSRAMHIQEQRYAAQQQLDNVKNLMAEQKSIDSNLNSIHSMLQKIQESVLTGMSEDWGATSREVIAKQIEQQMEQLLQFANAQFGGHTLFGGTNNSVPPFTVNEATGKLQFNGIDVDQIFKSAADGKYYYYPGVEDPDHPGNFQYSFTLSGGGIDGTLFAYGDGTTFHLDGYGDGLKYTEIDGTKYYYDDTQNIYTNANGQSFQPNASGSGYDQVVIDGVTYTKGAGNLYYANTTVGVDPTSISGRVFKSDDGLTFTEMDVIPDPADPDNHIPNMVVGTEKMNGTVKTFAAPDPGNLTEEPFEFKVRAAGGYDQVVMEGKNYVKTGTDADGNLIYQSTDPNDKSVFVSSNGLTFRKVKDASGADDTSGTEYTFTAPEKVLGDLKEVPNSGATFADIGLGLRIKSSDMMADPRTAYQVSFSGLSILGCAGLSYDGNHPGPIIGANGYEVAGNLYDLLGQIKDALAPDFNKKALDDYYTQLVNLTDEVGMVRTDLGNRMQYLELTETRLDDDISNMTELESDLISSDPAEEAIKMKDCEYVWLALMQLGSKVLPASLLDFMS